MAGDRDRPFLIAGGGIGGLACAIALARSGVSVQILERAETFSEVGAGIQLGPNATRILESLGIGDMLKETAVTPEFLKIRDGETGKLLAAMPLGEEMHRRYGAPYCTVHRADLQSALLSAAREHSSVAISNGFEVARLEEHADAITVHSANGDEAEGAALIGADGVFSTLRRLMGLDLPPKASGKTAWRTLLDMKGLADPFDAHDVGLWLAPKAHLVHYPVRGGKALNVVAVIDGDWEHEGWNAEGDPNELLTHFDRWAAQPLALLRQAAAWRKWALVDLPPLERWHSGRTVLLGDAAHPVLPFLAQGGALAIEDAAALAHAHEQSNWHPEKAFDDYQAMRQARSQRVQCQSKRMGAVYHMRGVPRWSRDLTLWASPPAMLLKRFDWLYGARVAPH